MIWLGVLFSVIYTFLMGVVIVKSVNDNRKSKELMAKIECELLQHARNPNDE